MFLKDIQNKTHSKDYIEINQYKAKNKDKKHPENLNNTYSTPTNTNQKAEANTTQPDFKKKVN